MNQPAIQISHLCKTFLLGELYNAGYPTLCEAISGATSCVARSCVPKRWRRRQNSISSAATPPRRELFHALRDVSFDVQPGEVVGVVGRNGAGKSTFLKVLCRITPPTSGRVQIRGRIGSLLEVGTGFHPELTGRENIFLNGAILGMCRQQITKDFDAIVDFAEISRFLDTPVKRYSSGMYVRLAFAVASHMRPDVLIVDEVLAVGDTQFQKKCLGRMDEVRREGRTVLFVSHNMAAVRSLCTRCVLLEKGMVSIDDKTENVVQRYLQDGQKWNCVRSIPESAYRVTNDQARVVHVSVKNLSGAPQYKYCYQQPFAVEFECDIEKDVPDGHFEVSVSTPEGTHILYATTTDGGRDPQYLRRGRHVVQAIVDNVLLPREYVIDVGVHRQSGETLDFVPGACGFEVVRVGVDDQGHYPWPTTRGHVRGTANWSCSHP